MGNYKGELEWDPRSPYVGDINWITTCSRKKQSLLFTYSELLLACEKKQSCLEFNYNESLLPVRLLFTK